MVHTDNYIKSAFRAAIDQCLVNIMKLDSEILEHSSWYSTSYMTTMTTERTNWNTKLYKLFRSLSDYTGINIPNNNQGYTDQELIDMGIY